jgi:isoquinoline 1-oxidoreductase beta subunit
MASEENIKSATRKQFLELSACTSGAFILGCLLDSRIVAQTPAAVSTDALNAWVRITSDQAAIVVSQAEMGQGIMSTLPAVLAEELGADWDRVRLVTCPVADAYRNPRLNLQFTGNSESTTSFFDLMRRVGASAPEMLISAAADRWRDRDSRLSMLYPTVRSGS